MVGWGWVRVGWWEGKGSGLLVGGTQRLPDGANREPFMWKGEGSPHRAIFGWGAILEGKGDKQLNSCEFGTKGQGEDKNDKDWMATKYNQKLDRFLMRITLGVLNTPNGKSFVFFRVLPSLSSAGPVAGSSSPLSGLLLHASLLLLQCHAM